MAENEEKGVIIAVSHVGWAHDTFYSVQNGKAEPVEIDAYQAGSALLQPGEKITLPEPTPSG